MHRGLRQYARIRAVPVRNEACEPRDVGRVAEVESKGAPGLVTLAEEIAVHKGLESKAAQERKRSAIRAAPYQGQCLRQPFRAERQPPPEPAGRTTQKFPPPRTRGGGTKGGGEPLSFAQRRTAAEQKN